MHPNSVLTKKIPLCLAGQGRVLEIEVDPTMSMGQAIQKAGMNPGDFDVAAPAGDRLVSLEERPWDLVTSPADVFTLVPSAQVGREQGEKCSG